MVRLAYYQISPSPMEPLKKNFSTLSSQVTCCSLNSACTGCFSPAVVGWMHFCPLSCMFLNTFCKLVHLCLLEGLDHLWSSQNIAILHFGCSSYSPLLLHSQLWLQRNDRWYALLHFEHAHFFFFFFINQSAYHACAEPK